MVVGSVIPIVVNLSRGEWESRVLFEVLNSSPPEVSSLSPVPQEHTHHPLLLLPPLLAAPYFRKHESFL